ncbi:MAG: glycosyltransferase family 39 protein [Caldilineaceae bacterium]
MTIAPVLWGGAAIGLALAAQVRLTRGFIGDAAVLFAAALLLFLYQFGVKNAAALPVARPVGGRALPVLPRRWWWTAAGLALFLTATVLAVMAWREFAANEPATMRGWWLHIASVAAVLLAAYLLDGLLLPSSDGPPSLDTDPAPLRGVTVAWVLALLSLLALALRLWRFGSLPFGTWYDEANHALQAMRILSSADYRPIFDGTTNGPAHYTYLVALALRFMEPSAQAVRAVSVFLGVLTVPAGYLLGRELFDARSGLVLAALLAVSSWSITFSRLGMFATMSTPLFALLTAGFLLLALRTLRYAAFAWTGVWLGLGLNFYTSFRLFVFVVGLFLAYYIIVHWLWRRERLPARFWIGLVIVGLAALAVVAPLLLFSQKHPELFWARVQDTFIFADKTPDQRWPALWENVRKHVLMFNWHGDPNGRHNLPGAPMLDPVAAGLLVLGLGLALWRWRDPVWMLLPLWLGGALMGGILSLDFEAPQSLRANGTMPVVYVLAVAPIFVTWRAWRLRDGRYFPNALAVPLIALLLVPTLVLNVQRYFGRQAHDFAAWAAHSTAETIAAELLADLDPATDAYVISFFQHHPTVDLIARNAPPYRRLETTDHLPLPFDPTRGALLILDGEREALFQEARRLYPDATFTEHRAPFGGPPVVYSVRMTPEDVQSIQGLTATFYPGAAWDQPPPFYQPQVDFDIDWSTAAPLTPPFGVEWSGILRAPEYGIYQFQVEAPGATELFINENSVLSGSGTMLGAIMLAEGNHPVRLRTVVEDPADPGVPVWLWRPPDGGPTIVPGTVLYRPPVRNNGLLGRYFPNGDWSGGEAFARIDPQLDLYFHNPPLPRSTPWSGPARSPSPSRATTPSASGPSTSRQSGSTEPR